MLTTHFIFRETLEVVVVAVVVEYFDTVLSSHYSFLV